ncbi:hypothetical protein BS47DRAFT_1343983 [Hydnum rufescens UP504]|uniref:Uncharacterized protein n=1 Tax=Hydnum rufescens UP504 TaxID=1448309 RepID=A0A9P6AXP9_9AGAM|nr:hypothetical protein BS47DRAFT_1343983 [Hydnum rufescens UP504]
MRMIQVVSPLPLFRARPVIRTWNFGVKEPVTPAVPYVRANLFYRLIWLFFSLSLHRLVLP